MSVPLRNALGASGSRCVRLHACTLAAYSVAGTQAPAVGDVVTFDATGNMHVELAEDDRPVFLGQVTKVELAPAGTDAGYVVVDWFDVQRFVEVDCDDATSATLLNSAIKDGDTTVVNNFDAGATTGTLIVVGKSAAAGACKLTCAVAARS